MDDPARARRRFTWLLAIGLLLILPAAVALQLGAAADWQTLWLALLVVGCLTAIAAGAAVTRINLRGLRGEGATDALHDELAVRNSVRSMAIGYGAFLFLGSLALPLAFLLDLPALPVLTAILLLAVACHLAAFAQLERQGDE